MKICKLFISFDSRPSRLCGIETGTAIALSAGAGLIGSTVSTSMKNSSNEFLNDRQMRFSAEEAEKQRQFQKDEWTRQYELQREEWYNQLHAQSAEQWQQYLRQAEYNLPKNQVQRMSEAGLNPSAVLGGSGSSGLVSAATGNISSVGTPSVPSGGSVSGAAASTPSQIPMDSVLGNLLPNVGSFIRDLAQASKDNKLTSPMVQLLGAQYLGQNLKNDIASFEKDVLSQTKDVKVLQAWQDLATSFAQESLYHAMGKNYDADTLVKNADEFLKRCQAKLTDEQFKEVEFRVTHMFETWSAEQKVRQSESAKNFADAGYSVARTKTEDENRENIVNLTKFQSDWQDTQNKLADIDYKIKAGTYDEQLTLACRKFVEEAKREQLITQRAAAEAEKAIKENDWWLFMNVVSPTIKMVSDKHTEMANIGVNILKFFK